MKGFLRKLAPFSPDYSGVNAVFHELGGLVIINGADGCIGNVTGYDEPRFFSQNTLIVSSGLREINAIIGDEESLMQKINDLGLKQNINFVILLGTPTSAVIASDHKGISKLVTESLEIPVHAIGTTGMETYEIGVEKGLLKLAESFVQPLEVKTGGVNIIGCTPLDYWGPNQVNEMILALETEQVKVNSCWTMREGICGIRKTLAADINLVVSTAGIKAAKYLEERYGIPYVVGVPIGKQGTKKIADQIKQVCDMDELVERSTDKRDEIDTLIIGDHVWANSFRNYLEFKNKKAQIVVGSFFMMAVEYLRDDDCSFESEDDFLNKVALLKPKKIIGDPMYKKLLKESWAIQFVEIPHLAVSSRLHWDHEITYVGNNIEIV